MHMDTHNDLLPCITCRGTGQLDTKRNTIVCPACNGTCTRTAWITWCYSLKLQPELILNYLEQQHATWHKSTTTKKSTKLQPQRNTMMAV